MNQVICPGIEAACPAQRSSTMILALACLLPAGAAAQPFQLPTTNRALFEKGGEERFFVGTVGKPWTSGTFGCVRTDGGQMHEGLDIRCLHRDPRGEPTDPVLATAAGTIAYINTKPGLSNYGNYIVLRHRIEGMEVFSLYAHLREVRPGLKTGQNVTSGEVIATMGRTTNTRERISLERAHVHFELNLFVNDRFSAWHKTAHPGERNDHGDWNGQNLAGLDPRLILLAQHNEGTNFSLVRFIRRQTAVCRVFVRAARFPWVQRHAPLLRPNPKADNEGVAGYEIALNFNGLPIELIPRAKSEFPGKARFELLSVNETEQQSNPCRRLVAKRGARWELTSHGMQWLELITY